MIELRWVERVVPQYRIQQHRIKEDWSGYDGYWRWSEWRDIPTTKEP